jgi:release factor glutamine methyltransferase
MKTVLDALERAEIVLQSAGLEDPRMESEFLVASLLGCSRTEVRLRRGHALNKADQNRVQGWILERAARKPLAYVTGEQTFFNASFHVSPDVLVPRPETELLVETVQNYLASAGSRLHLLDVGTGSGAVALSLAGHAHIETVTAIDISRAALRMARQNAERLSITNVSWVESNLLEQLSDVRVDVIVANLPYVRTGELRSLAPELHWEPVLALDGGADGLQIIDRLIVQAATRLRTGGALFLEIGHDQGAAVQTRLRASGNWGAIGLKTDFAGLPRIVSAIRKG